ncbi:cation:proton antiporter regulatory subunit [Leucobacter sp. HY1910]
MPSDDSIEVNESPLPGIGLRDDFVTAGGKRVGVVSHHTGQRDLVVYDDNDPDACAASVSLTPGEADTLAEFLGTRRVVERLAQLSEQVESLRTKKLTVAAGSRFDGAALGHTQVRSRTGASIVAVLRGAEAIASPPPSFTLNGGDELIVVGTDEALTAVATILEQP